jgi:hypothetical protein
MQAWQGFQRNGDLKSARFRTNCLKLDKNSAANNGYKPENRLSAALLFVYL